MLCDAPYATCTAQDMTSTNEKHSRMAVCNECSGKGDLISERLEEGICSDGSAEPATTEQEEERAGGHVTLAPARISLCTGFGVVVYDGSLEA